MVINVGILDKLVEKKDLLAYIHYRMQHLELEKQKLPYTISNPKKRELAIRHVSGRIDELGLLKECIEHSDVKEKSKFFASKVRYLKKKKAEMVKKSDN